MALSCAIVNTVGVGVGSGGRVAVGEGIGVAVGTKVGVAVISGVVVGVTRVAGVMVSVVALGVSTDAARAVAVCSAAVKSMAGVRVCVGVIDPGGESTDKIGNITTAVMVDTDDGVIVGVALAASPLEITGNMILRVAVSTFVGLGVSPDGVPGDDTLSNSLVTVDSRDIGSVVGGWVVTVVGVAGVSVAICVKISPITIVPCISGVTVGNGASVAVGVDVGVRAKRFQRPQSSPTSPANRRRRTKMRMSRSSLGQRWYSLDDLDIIRILQVT